MGTSVENSSVMHRIDSLAQIPAQIRFLSCEPLLGPLPNLPLDGIHWVIAGAESGQKARHMDENWVRTIRDQCQVAHVPFFYKQKHDGVKKVSLPELDGQQYMEMPA